MRDFGPETFGELNADDYDQLHDPGTTEASVELLASLVPAGGRVLELAIGTGRVALPLAARGLAVSGVEASPAMIAKLREKPGGEAIPVTLGDMAEVSAEGSFDLVFLIFNTLFNLTTQEAQIRCVARAAQALTDGGVFVVEAYVPDPSKFIDQQRVRVRHLGRRSLALEATVHDPVAQVINQSVVRFDSGGPTLTPLPTRYAWPAELDLMARLAGLRLRERWGGWDRAPFTARSTMHVSVYARDV